VRIADWVAQHGHTLGVYPTQLFESVGQLVLFMGLMYARRFRRFHGHILALWLMAYAVLRSTVELFRGDVERGTLHGLLQSLGAQGLADAVPLEAWYNMSTSQFISLCMFTFGAVLLAQKGRRREGEAAGGLGPTPSAA
jgi:phosphatidylglycerol:prolipoprotein diacylglycerol transferase